MFRVVLTVDCDRCGQSYYKATVSTDTEPLLWEFLAHDLKSCAAFDGWSIDVEDGSEHQSEIICDECLDAEEQGQSASDFSQEAVPVR